ncbi:MAG: hypothetical protein AB8F95_15150 [Bacteroidia bacterium]
MIAWWWVLLDTRRKVNQEEAEEGMKSLAQYIKKLPFEYAVSFSGLRGEPFFTLQKEISLQIEVLESEYDKARYMDKQGLRYRITKLKKEIDIFDARIITLDGTLHKSAQAIHRFDKRSKELKTIVKILKTKCKEQWITLCIPEYRDAIAFYSKEGKIIDILHICFGCISIINEYGDVFEVDQSVFPKLYTELKQVGHEIQDTFH